MMLLTIDAGNTNIVFAVFEEETQKFSSRIDTNAARMADQYAVMLDDILRLYGLKSSEITGAIISSVVPPVTRQLSEAVKRILGVEPLNVEPGLKTGLNIKLDDHVALIGADLICAATAAKTLYPCPCVVMDLGTVTKVLAVDKTGTLIGGSLCAGVGMSFEAMAGKTALLPLVGEGKMKKVIGSNTVDCIRSGILFGTAFMLDGFIEKFEEEMGEKCSLVATGGFAETAAVYCKRDIIINKGLVSEGLRIIYDKNNALKA